MASTVAEFEYAVFRNKGGREEETQTTHHKEPSEPQRDRFDIEAHMTMIGAMFDSWRKEASNDDFGQAA